MSWEGHLRLLFAPRTAATPRFWRIRFTYDIGKLHGIRFREFSLGRTSKTARDSILREFSLGRTSKTARDSNSLGNCTGLDRLRANGFATASDFRKRSSARFVGLHSAHADFRRTDSDYALRRLIGRTHSLHITQITLLFFD